MKEITASASRAYSTAKLEKNTVRFLDFIWHRVDQSALWRRHSKSELVTHVSYSTISPPVQVCHTTRHYDRTYRHRPAPRAHLNHPQVPRSVAPFHRKRPQQISIRGTPRKPYLIHKHMSLAATHPQHRTTSHTLDPFVQTRKRQLSDTNTYVSLIRPSCRVQSHPRVHMLPKRNLSSACK